MKTCENCGERVYALGCVNCNEDAYMEAANVREQIRLDALGGEEAGSVVAPKICVACAQGQHTQCLGGSCECVHAEEEFSAVEILGELATQLRCDPTEILETVQRLQWATEKPKPDAALAARPARPHQEVHNEPHASSRSETVSARPLEALGVLAPERASVVSPRPQFEVSSAGESGTSQTWRGCDAQAEGRELGMVVKSDAALHALRARLQPFLQHLRDCPQAMAPDPNDSGPQIAIAYGPCTCGLDQALAELENVTMDEHIERILFQTAAFLTQLQNRLILAEHERDECAALLDKIGKALAEPEQT
jgi:hypothetical protein